MAADTKRKGPYLDLLVFLTCVCLIASVRVNGVLFLSGLSNFAIDKIPFGSLLLSAVVATIIIGCIFLLVARFNNRLGGTRLPQRIGWFFLIALLPMSLMAALLTRPPGVEGAARGLETRIRFEADIPAVRAWAASLPPASSNQEISESAWPDCVKKLSPNQVYPSVEGQGVRLCYGGGFLGHYELLVGSYQMPRPESSGSRAVDTLEPGVYFIFFKE